MRTAKRAAFLAPFSGMVASGMPGGMEMFDQKAS